MEPYSSDELNYIRDFLDFMMNPLIKPFSCDNAFIYKLSYKLNCAYHQNVTNNVRVMPWNLTTNTTAINATNNLTVMNTSGGVNTNATGLTGSLDASYIYKPIVSLINFELGLPASSYRGNLEISEGLINIADLNSLNLNAFAENQQYNLDHCGGIEMISIFPEIGKFVETSFFNATSSLSFSYKFFPYYSVNLSPNGTTTSGRIYISVCNYYYARRVKRPNYRNEIDIRGGPPVISNDVRYLLDLDRFKVYNMRDKVHRDNCLQYELNCLNKYGRERKERSYSYSEEEKDEIKEQNYKGKEDNK